MGLIPFLSPISIVQQMVVAPSEFDFEKAVSRLREAIDKDFGKGNKPNEYISVFQQIGGSESDRKNASDQCIKSYLQNHLKNSGDPSIWDRLRKERTLQCFDALYFDKRFFGL